MHRCIGLISSTKIWLNQAAKVQSLVLHTPYRGNPEGDAIWVNEQGSLVTKIHLQILEQCETVAFQNGMPG
jgi:hypothetical protein